MAKRTNGPSDTPVARAAPKRRKAVGTSANRKAQPGATEPIVKAAEFPEPGPAGLGGGATTSDEEIAKRAYEIYLRRGSRNGYDFDDWLEAERELRGRGTR